MTRNSQSTRTGFATMAMAVKMGSKSAGTERRHSQGLNWCLLSEKRQCQALNWRVEWKYFFAGLGRLGGRIRQSHGTVCSVPGLRGWGPDGGR